jgi:hypothetical protein
MKGAVPTVSSIADLRPDQERSPYRLALVVVYEYVADEVRVLQRPRNGNVQLPVLETFRWLVAHIEETAAIFTEEQLAEFIRAGSARCELDET